MSNERAAGDSVNIERPNGLLDIARLVLYAACFCIPLTAIRGGAGLPLSDMLLIVAGTVSIFAFPTGRMYIPRPWILASILSALAIVVLEFDPSSASPANVSAGFRLVFVFLVWPAVTIIVLRTGIHYSRAIYSYVLGATFSAAVGVVQLLGFDLRPYLFAEIVAQKSDMITASDYRFIGLSGQPNGQAGALAVAVALVLGLFLAGRKKVASIAVLVVLCAGVVATASITGAIAVATATAVALVRSRRIRSLFRLTVVIFATFIAITFVQNRNPDFDSPLTRYSNQTVNGGTNTLELRMETIQYAWNTHIKEFLFAGVGFAEDKIGTIDSETQVHNIFVLAWYQGGILLFISLCVAGGYSIIVAWPRKRSHIAEGLSVAVFVAIFFAQTGPALFDRYIWFAPVLLTTGYPRLLGGRRQSSDESRPELLSDEEHVPEQV